MAIKFPVTQMVGLQKSSCGNTLHGAVDFGPLSLRKKSAGNRRQSLPFERARATERAAGKPLVL